MIKIQLTDERSILDYHYNNLTKKNGRKANVITKLEKYRRKYKVGSKTYSFYDFLLNKTQKDSAGFSILTAKPHELSNFITVVESKYHNVLNKKRKKELNLIFYYDDYDRWNAYELAKKINVQVCPYCNRLYTFTVGSDLRKGTRFEYDHFYLKSSYPYLALSFFNLVPSCHVCNSNLRGHQEFNIDDNIHPYIEGFSDNIVFTIEPQKITFLNGNHSAYKIKFKKAKSSSWSIKKSKAALRNIKVFRLRELYNMHQDYVDEIIQKSIVYNPTYIASLFQKYQGTLFQTIDDTRRFALGNYTLEDHYQRRPLAKITTDIARELAII